MRFFAPLTLLVASTAAACGGTDAAVPDEHAHATSNQATDPVGAINVPGPTNLGGHETNVTCCVGNTVWECPTSLACMGGFDFGGCIQACGSDPDCLYVCATRVRAVKGPSSECRKLATTCLQ